MHPRSHTCKRVRVRRVQQDLDSRQICAHLKAAGSSWSSLTTSALPSSSRTCGTGMTGVCCCKCHLPACSGVNLGLLVGRSASGQAANEQHLQAACPASIGAQGHDPGAVWDPPAALGCKPSSLRRSGSNSAQKASSPHRVQGEGGAVAQVLLDARPALRGHHGSRS